MLPVKKDSVVELRNLVLIRKFEEAVLRLFRDGKVNGTTHTCIGQEEIPLAVMPHLEQDDFIFSTHRGHGHYLARTGDTEGLLAEIMGKEGGINNGTGGSQHISTANFLSSGIQGETMPVAAGVAWHFKQSQKKNIAVQFIGDGTWGQGIVYETLNLASLLRLPLLIICENNSIAQSTPIGMNMSGSIESRVKSFGIRYLRVMNDILSPANCKQIELLTRLCREENSPTVIEFITNRLEAHSKGDDSRSSAEIEELKQNDWRSREMAKNKERLLRIEKETEEKIATLVTEIEMRPFAQLTKFVPAQAALQQSERNTSGTVLQNLNAALHAVLTRHENAVFIGEDLADPYGGAFKVSKGLSTAFPSRVISAPISEAAIAGFANGVARTGNPAIAEFMFGDFIFLAADQVINFASKALFNYGSPKKHPVLFRCPVGGKRGYGATHSQSVQKYFIGVPGLHLYELSPLHDNISLLPSILEHGVPSILFEQKTLYAADMFPTGVIRQYYTHSRFDGNTSVLALDSRADVIIITGGGMLDGAMDAAIELFRQHEISVHIVNPFRIHPFDAAPLQKYIDSNCMLCTIEEGTAGGTWGNEVAQKIRERKRNADILCLHSDEHIIPSSRLQEEEVLLAKNKIINSILVHHRNK